MKRERKQQENGDSDNDDDDLHRTKRVVKTLKTRDLSESSDQGKKLKLHKEDAENHKVSEDSKLKKEQRDENPHMDDQDSLQEPQDEGKHFKDLFIFSSINLLIYSFLNFKTI